MKIGELAREAGVTAKTVRYYEQLGLLEEPPRTEARYRIYGPAHAERLEFIVQAKRLGLLLGEVRDILTLHEQRQAPCVHVLALLDQKLEQVQAIMEDLQQFQREVRRLKAESERRLAGLPVGARICGIIEQGIHARGEVALAWLEGRGKARKDRLSPRPS
ncbi:MAG: heavy metal-responsive transcriptional regulator [Chloroflexi bacterium]|nr:heavy metal-responsive transcriptional regulator [Chloroflexota bacterium]